MENIASMNPGTRIQALVIALYCHYESIIKTAESKLSSITSADSEILAVRKSLFTGIKNKQLNYDDAIVYELVKKGYRVIYESDANAFGNTPNDIKDDFKSTSKNAEAFYRLTYSEKSKYFHLKHCSALCSYPIRALHLFVPFYASPVTRQLRLRLQQHKTIQVLLIIQIVIYSFTLLSWFLRKTPIFRGYTSIIMYFVLMNIAVFYGFLKYLFSSFKGLFSRKKQLKRINLKTRLQSEACF